MNERRVPVFLLLAVLAGSARPVEAHAESPAPPGASTVTARDVVKLVVKQNPTVAAAVTELRRAELLEEGEEHRYPFTFLGDATALRNGAPALGPTFVTFPESTNLVAGAELRKKLVWGTSLALRMEATRQESVTLFTFGTDGGTGPGGGGAGAGTPVQTLFQLGPGYGGSVRLGLTQPLLRGAGRTIVQAELNAARVGHEAARSTRDRTSSQALRDALTAYWELYYATRAVDIQKKSLALARQQRDETAARIRTGGTAPVEQLTFETRIATLEEDITAAEAEERLRSAALARTVGDSTLAFRRAGEVEPPRYGPTAAGRAPPRTGGVARSA